LSVRRGPRDTAGAHGTRSPSSRESRYGDVSRDSRGHGALGSRAPLVERARSVESNARGKTLRSKRISIVRHVCVRDVRVFARSCD
jgi:hypothetical protein